MITPIALIKATVYGMADRGFGRIVNITSYSVKAPVSTLELSNGARAGLTGGIAALARKVADRNVAINGLLPGPYATGRLLNTSKAIAEKTGRTCEEVHAERAAELPTKRFGTPEEFGAACAFLCSAHAGNIIGQNLVMDGGSHVSTL